MTDVFKKRSTLRLQAYRELLVQQDRREEQVPRAAKVSQEPQELPVFQASKVPRGYLEGQAHQVQQE